MSKPRFGARVDEVAPVIVDTLRASGVKVLVLDVGEEGAPDVLCGWLGRLTLIELKSPGGRLSEAQKREHEAWARVGVKVATCKTPREALTAMGIVGERAAANLRALRLLVSERRRVAKVEGKAASSVKSFRERP